MRGCGSSTRASAHRASAARTRRRYHGLEGLLLGDLSRERSVWLPRLFAQRQQGQDHHHHHHHHHRGGQRDSFLESPLRAVGRCPSRGRTWGCRWPSSSALRRATASPTRRSPWRRQLPTKKRCDASSSGSDGGKRGPSGWRLFPRRRATRPEPTHRGGPRGAKRLEIASSSASVVDEFELVWVELEGLSGLERMRRLADVTVVIGGALLAAAAAAWAAVEPAVVLPATWRPPRTRWRWRGGRGGGT